MIELHTSSEAWSFRYPILVQRLMKTHKIPVQSQEKLERIKTLLESLKEYQMGSNSNSKKKL